MSIRPGSINPIQRSTEFRPASPITLPEIENFIAASPSREMIPTLAEMADGQVVSMDKRTHKFLVNIDKKSGSDKDFDRIRQIHGVPESAVKTTEDGWPMFLTPDGSRVVKREKSSDGRLTVEIQVENPDWDHLSKGRKQKTPALKIRCRERKHDHQGR